MSGELRLEALEIALEGRVIVALDLTVAPGEVLTIMGPSGAGKSTLLAVISGHLEPAFRVSGRVVLAGRDITGLPAAVRRVGMLFQDDLLFPHLSVGGNLGFALPPGIRGPQRHARIEAALAEAGMAGMSDRDPATLSGGQRARVALMRTLLAEPEALLLDEPFSRLDTQLRERMREFVFHHAKSKGLPTVLVTHDSADATAAGGAVFSPTGAPIQPFQAR